MLATLLRLTALPLVLIQVACSGVPKTPMPPPTQPQPISSRLAFDFRLRPEPPVPTDTERAQQVLLAIKSQDTYPAALATLCDIRSTQVLAQLDHDIKNGNIEHAGLLRRILEMVDSFVYLRHKHNADFDLRCLASIERRNYGITVYGLYLNVSLTEKSRWPLSFAINSSFPTSLRRDELQGGNWRDPPRSQFMVFPAVEGWLRGLPQNVVLGMLPSRAER